LPTCHRRRPQRSTHSPPGPGKSRVVVARDASLHSSGGQLDETRVLLFSTAPSPPTRHDKAVEAWKQILPAGASDKVIGIKTNGSAAEVSPLTPCWPTPLPNDCSGQRQARKHHHLGPQRARSRGLRLHHQYRFQRVRIFGSDVSALKTSRSIRFRRQRQAPKSSPPMRHGDRPAHSQRHSGAGVTFSMKNMYGVVQRPNELHAAAAIPAWPISTASGHPRKVRFTS